MDARGRRVRTLDSRVAIKGEDLRLTLDMGVQKLAVELLAGHKGALVAMDVKTGAILALASSPTYDNNPLAWGVSGREWRDITRDPAKPMLDRSIAGVYPPASTFKALVALTAPGGKCRYDLDVLLLRRGASAALPDVSLLEAQRAWHGQRAFGSAAFLRRLFLSGGAEARDRSSAEVVPGISAG